MRHRARPDRRNNAVCTRARPAPRSASDGRHQWFVELAGGSGDAFLHAAVLEHAGHGAVDPGASLEVRAGPGQKGMQVTEVLSIDSSTATQEPAQRARPERPAPSRPAGPLVQETGTVKFYNAVKGYGFI